MTKSDYTRSRLIQFIQQTLSKNKSNNKYFDLDNNDKLFVDLKVQSWSTKVMLISSSRLRNDIFLWESNLRDFKWITLFVNYIDSLLDKYKAKKGSTVLDLTSDNDFIDESNMNYDFDDILWSK